VHCRDGITLRGSRSMSRGQCQGPATAVTRWHTGPPRARARSCSSFSTASPRRSPPLHLAVHAGALPLVAHTSDSIRPIRLGAHICGGHLRPAAGGVGAADQPTAAATLDRHRPAPAHHRHPRPAHKSNQIGALAWRHPPLPRGLRACGGLGCPGLRPEALRPEAQGQAPAAKAVLCLASPGGGPARSLCASHGGGGPPTVWRVRRLDAHAGPHRRKWAFPTLQPTFKLPNRTAINSHGGSQRPGSCPRTNHARDRCASPHGGTRLRRGGCGGLGCPGRRPEACLRLSPAPRAKLLCACGPRRPRQAIEPAGCRGAKHAQHRGSVQGGGGGGLS
jgi:hypothetical protein